MMDSHEMKTERQIQKAVDEVLKTNEWPIYRTQDDNGLEAHEYFEFVKAVLRKLCEVGIYSPNEQKTIVQDAHSDTTGWFAR
jgi:hypothetical protein